VPPSFGGDGLGTGLDGTGLGGTGLGVDGTGLGLGGTGLGLDGTGLGLDGTGLGGTGLGLGGTGLIVDLGRIVISAQFQNSSGYGPVPHTAREGELYCCGVLGGSQEFPVR
jgi:hypothetical protein